MSFHRRDRYVSAGILRQLSQKVLGRIIPEIGYTPKGRDSDSRGARGILTNRFNTRSGPGDTPRSERAECDETQVGWSQRLAVFVFRDGLLG